MSDLIVDFVGEIHTVAPADTFTFGRKGDLVVDSNRHLHRLLGRFSFDSGIWWLTNEGRHISIEVLDTDSRSRQVVAPGTSVALTFASAVLSFKAGASSYEIEVRQESSPAADGGSQSETDVTGDFTISAADVPLTPDQRALIVGLASPQLRDPGGGLTLPTNRELAQSLGWSLSKTERKIDNVCQKFAKAGVRGLHGGPGELAKNRRGRLVEYAIEIGLVSTADLD